MYNYKAVNNFNTMLKNSLSKLTIVIYALSRFLSS